MSNGSRAADQALRRLFFALACEQAPRQAIARWRAELPLRAGRRVPSENFHLTLMFLGDVPLAQINAVCETAASVTPPGGPLVIELDRLELWHRSAALVLTPSQTPAMLRQFVYALHQALLPLGFEDTQKDYRPHLTLMRDYRGPHPEASSAPAFRLVSQRFVLYESHKGGYRPLAEWGL